VTELIELGVPDALRTKVNLIEDALNDLDRIWRLEMSIHCHMPGSRKFDATSSVQGSRAILKQLKMDLFEDGECY